MVEWKQKLSSRKFLTAISTAIFIIATQGLGYDIDSNTYWQISSVAIGYIIGESIVDANRN